MTALPQMTAREPAQGRLLQWTGRRLWRCCGRREAVVQLWDLPLLCENCGPATRPGRLTNFFARLCGGGAGCDDSSSSGGARCGDWKSGGGDGTGCGGAGCGKRGSGSGSGTSCGDVSRIVVDSVVATGETACPVVAGSAVADSSSAMDAGL
jgi:hypothetical protein